MPERWGKIEVKSVPPSFMDCRINMKEDENVNFITAFR